MDNESNVLLINKNNTFKQKIGILYTLDQQCQISFGPNALFCSNNELNDDNNDNDECVKLWCRLKDQIKCFSINSVGDGTYCNNSTNYVTNEWFIFDIL